MTTVLTPNREAFFGGTYFPARDGDRGSRKGFFTILKELKAEYTQNKAQAFRRRKQITQRRKPPRNLNRQPRYASRRTDANRAKTGATIRASIRGIQSAA